MKGISVFWATSLAIALALSLSASNDSSQRQLIDRYCIGCHNQKLKTAGISLDAMELGAVGEKVLRKVRGGEMPPPGLPRPDAALATTFTTWLENALDRA